MRQWTRHPIIYEINTWVWLQELGERLQRPISLQTVPVEEWDAIAALRVDAVWLMGVWERSPAAARIAIEHPASQAEYRRALPDFSPADVVGSPFAVHRYVADKHLGGPAGLAAARSALAQRGLKLVLDFVPNHVAVDHPWVRTHPECFIQGRPEDLLHKPDYFFESGERALAHGKDPYFPPWTDTAQLNAFHPGVRKAAATTIEDLATQCDGVRCDMAMLFVNAVFERNWGYRAGAQPTEEFWTEVIEQVGRNHPHFLFVAEAYWDLEWDLLEQGFHYCYDKRLYDRLVHETADTVRRHLLADLSYQQRLIRFIENHDEARAAAVLPNRKARACAVATATLPGARLFHEGQFEGRRVRLPVQLRRRPHESVDRDLHSFYLALVQALDQTQMCSGQWRLCERSGWPDNSSYLNLIAWSWRKAEEWYLIVVNLSDFRSQGLIQVPWEEMARLSWLLSEVLGSESYERDGGEMRLPGLYVDLDAWGFHFLRASPL